MTERFTKGYHTIRDTYENKTYDFRVDIICGLLNELDEKWIDEFSLRETLQQELQRVEEENEQLKQDNNALTHLLENQSMIIQELHSKLLEYQIQEPIVLTKEDLELMGKAISYYTHGRYAE